MFWHEDPDPVETAAADAVVDVLFALDCRELPVDHAHALSRALLGCVPWLADAPGCGLHTVHVAGSQNGWERPTHGVDQHILLSKRTKLGVRVPAGRVDELTAALQGRRLDIDGCPLGIGAGKPRRLLPEATLLARHVVAPTDQQGEPGSEDAFLTWAAGELTTLGIKVRKALCGKVTPLATPDGPLITRSLLLANLPPDESLRLQQQGLGPGRAMGCGIFIPHKGIEAVGKGRA